MRDGDAAAPPIIDHAVLDGLREVLDTAALQSLMAEAETELGRRLDAIEEAVRRGDGGEALRALAHDLAGFGGQIGLAALAEAARILEHDIRTGGESAQSAKVLISLGAPSLQALRAARKALSQG